MKVTQADINRQVALLEQHVEQNTIHSFNANVPAIVENVELQGMDGLGKFGLKNITKAISHASQVIKAAPKKTLTFAKLSVTNPKAALHMAVAENKTVMKESVKVGQKVAPVAIAAAAVYFGGPAAYAALQGATTASVVSGATTLLKGVSVVQALEKLRASNPTAAAQLQTLPPVQVAQSPLVQQAASDIIQQQQYDTTGTVMASDPAQQLVQMQAAQGSQEVAAALKGQASPVKKASPAATAATIGIPVALILAKATALI